MFYSQLLLPSLAVNHTLCVCKVDPLKKAIVSRQGMLSPTISTRSLSFEVAGNVSLISYHRPVTFMSEWLPNELFVFLQYKRKAN